VADDRQTMIHQPLLLPLLTSSPSLLENPDVSNVRQFQKRLDLAWEELLGDQAEGCGDLLTPGSCGRRPYQNCTEKNRRS